VTAWEYAYLYQVDTDKISPLGEIGPAIYIVEDAAGVQIIEDVHTPLAAFNAAGSDGWIVQIPELSRLEVHYEMINELLGRALGLHIRSGWIYAMRRTQDPGPSPSS
jgi:hypothetical protein